MPGNYHCPATHFHNFARVNKQPEQLFTGPVFVVGMPRSGTKLLRDLLNRHPHISIPVCETHFIPYFFQKFGEDPPFQSNEDFQLFLDELMETNFIADLKEQNIHFNKTEYFQQVDIRSWNSIYEHLLKQLGPKSTGENSLWGDKTPGYLLHLPLLKKLFPAAKFIHILRDPRDYCNSVRNTWGKSIYRAAQRWVAAISSARKDASSFKFDYKEVQYEELLQSPKEVMKDLCVFLQKPYHDNMITLAKPSENLGDARGQSKIVKTNKLKFLNSMTKTEIRRIEQITFPVLNSLNYEIRHADKAVPPGAMQLKAFKIYDGFKVLWFMMNEKGWINGFQYFFKSRKVISWK